MPFSSRSNTSIRSIVTTATSNSNKNDSYTTVGMSSQSTFGSPSPMPKQQRRGSLGALSAKIRRSSATGVPDDDVSIRSSRTTKSTSSYSSRRFKLPFMGGAKDDASTSPKSVASSKSAKVKVAKASDGTIKEGKPRQRSKTPTQLRGRSKTPMQQRIKQAASRSKSPVLTPTKIKTKSKASQKSPRVKQQQQPPDSERSMELHRMNSGAFHEPYSSSDDEEERNGGRGTPIMSPIRVASPRSGGTPTRVKRNVGLEKTWSCSAMSTHSTGAHSIGESSAQMNLYIDSDEESDFDTDDEAERVMSGKKKKEKKSRRGRRAPRRMTKSQRKESKEAEEAAAKAKVIPESIQEGEEGSEESEEDDFGDRSSTTSVKRVPSDTSRYLHERAPCLNFSNRISSNEELDDMASACSYKMPAFGTMLGLAPARKEVMPGRHGNGYSSDSSVVRKRIALAKQQKKEQRKLEKKNKDNKKKKSKPSKKDKPVETLSKELSPGSVYGSNPYLQRGSDNTFEDYNFDEIEEISARSSRSHIGYGVYALRDDGSSTKSERRSRSSSRRRSKKEKKKKSRKSKKSSKSSAPYSDDDIYGEDDVSKYLNNDSFSSSAKEKLEVTERMMELDSCFEDIDRRAEAVTKKTYDQRFEEVEKFEALLFEERERLQKERATIAFERESLDLQLQEEVERNETLALKVSYLEKQLQANETLGKANTAELSAELHDLKVNFDVQKKALIFQLSEKDKIISDLKSRDTINTSLHSGDSSHDSSMGGKSRERLQGELLQTRSKLMETQQLLDRQTSELEALHEELMCHKDGTALFDLQDDLNEAKKQTNDLQQELSKERNNNAIKLKEKDETIEFLMSELAKLKQEQSMNSSMSSLRRGSANNEMTGFLGNHPGLSFQPRISHEEMEREDTSVHRRGSISSYFTASRS